MNYWYKTPWWKRPWVDILGGWHYFDACGKELDHVYKVDGLWKAYPETFRDLRIAKHFIEKKHGQLTQVANVDSISCPNCQRTMLPSYERWHHLHVREGSVQLYVSAFCEKCWAEMPLHRKLALAKEAYAKYGWQQVFTWQELSTAIWAGK